MNNAVSQKLVNEARNEKERLQYEARQKAEEERKQKLRERRRREQLERQRKEEERLKVEREKREVKNAFFLWSRPHKFQILKFEYILANYFIGNHCEKQWGNFGCVDRNSKIETKNTSQNKCVFYV